jgi:predicted TIM-barrel fold metal-dependent hydrolase
MYKGYKIIDMDTHVGPRADTLEKYIEPSFRARLPELEPYKRTRVAQREGGKEERITILTVAPLTFNRFPGTAPAPGDIRSEHGMRGTAQGRAMRLHRGPVQPGTDQENSQGRLKDMDLEGRDIDLMFPSDWAASITAIEDVTLAEGLWRAFHRYLCAYTAADPDRLKGTLQVPGSDPAWAVSEIKMWGKEKWAAAVWVHLKEGLPVDHPDLEPIWATMSEFDLPLVHHSFFYEPPYFPGYKDMWGNSVVARTAAHPWGAARFFAYVILSGMLDRYPNFRVSASEVGHGWLPNWLIRLGFNNEYVQGVTPRLKHTPLEYAQMGRVRCAAEPFEGSAMTKACIEILGEDCLMHQSDYPHGESWFPETAKEVIEWPIWSELSNDALKKYMHDNAAKFLRLS